MCDQCVLGADIDGVVDLPVYVTHFTSRMEQTLLREKNHCAIRRLDLTQWKNNYINSKQLCRFHVGSETYL